MLQFNGLDNRHTVTVPFGEKEVKLSFVGFDTEIDMDEYTSVNYSNIYGELVTIAPLLNRVGMWKADAEHDYDQYKLECDIEEARLAEYYRKSLTKVEGSGTSAKMKLPTKDQVDNAVKIDAKYSMMRRKMYRLKKESQYMDKFYWSISTKGSKLNKISESMNLTPEAFEANIVEGKINGYILNKSKRNSHRN